MTRSSFLGLVVLAIVLPVSHLYGEDRHWAFRAPVRPPIPGSTGESHADTPIDRFIAAALRGKGLTPNPRADRVTLLRRVSFDLTGLPPTPAAIEVFLADQSADAYERMVERYLASPRYGERWGKLWLDAAGFADSNGYFSADSDRPLAFRYRDYVIRSFNRDKPYDRFVFEQLAGDELAGYTPGCDVSPAMAEMLAATHFLRNAPDGTGESDGNPDEVRTDRFTVLEGNLQNTMNCLLGITIQCARCHSHKLEPISQEEYYRLQAIFYPAYCPDRWIVPKDRVVPVASRAERAAVKRRNDEIDRQIKAIKDGLAIMAGPFRDQLVEERVARLEPALRASIREALRIPEAKRTKDQAALLAKHASWSKPTDADLGKRFPDFAAIHAQALRAIAARDKKRPPPIPLIAALVETDPNPPVHHILIRGGHGSPGKEAQPGVPAVMCSKGYAYGLDPRPKGQISTGRRTAFARWVTSPKNALLARVMVNRIWQHHFGVGLVATPDNFGKSGARPSHPELLDYLTMEFVRSGWSVKAMHRLIVQSAVYRQTSAVVAEGRLRDPDNRLLGRYPLRRLDAESVRDGMLAVAGEMDTAMGGPYVPTHRAQDGGVIVNEREAGARRRSVYLQQRRTQVATLLALFDAPAIVATCSSRTTSTVPLQSLALLNSEFARARALAFASRLEREVPSSLENRVTLAFRLTYGRPCSDRERQAACRFLDEQRAVYAREKDGRRRVWTDFCQMLLASNGFLYVE